MVLSFRKKSLRCLRKTFLISIAGWAIFGMAVCANAEFYGDVKTGFQEIKGDHYGASYYVPPAYSTEKDWPLVVILYSDETEKGARFNEKWLSELKKREVIALFVSYLAPREMPFASDERLLKHIRELAKMYRIDAGRILLTAFGEAAHYAFYAGFYYPNYFSAVALAGGGAEGRYEPFFEHGNTDAKKLPFLVLYGDQDKTIRKESFIPVHERLHRRGYQISLEELERFGHEFRPELAAKMMDWFGALPRTMREEERQSAATAGEETSLRPFNLPKYVGSLLRGVFKG